MAKYLRNGHGFLAGDRVRVLETAVPGWRRDLIGLEGRLVKTPAVGSNPVLTVRIDGGTADSHTEVQASADRFERLSAPRYDGA